MTDVSQGDKSGGSAPTGRRAGESASQAAAKASTKASTKRGPVASDLGATTSSVRASAILIAGLCALLISQRILDEGSLQDLVTYGGLGLLLLALGLRTSALSAAQGDVRAVEARLLGAYLGVAVSVGVYFLTTESGLSLLGVGVDPESRVPGVLRVLWMGGLLVSLFSVLFIELVYLRMPIVASVELRRVRSSLQGGLSLAFSIIFLLAINYVATERDVRKDVSYFKTTEPSESTHALLGKLDRPIRAVLFYERANDVLAQLEPYFEALADKSDKFEYEVVDVALVPELAREHKVRDNGQVLLLQPAEASAESTSSEAGSDGKPQDAPKDTPGGKPDPHASTAHDDKPHEKGETFEIGTQLTAARARLKKLDGSFQEAFRRLVEPERVLYMTVGHGERNAKSSELPAADGTSLMEEVLTRLNLKTEQLGMAQGLATAVPDGASAVLIVGPTEPFLSEEVDSLLAYVRKGGRLFLMIDPDQDVGLERLYRGLGIKVLPGTVLSDSKHMRRANNASDRAIVYTNRYSAHPSVTTASRHSQEVATVLYHGVAVERAKPSDVPEPRPRVTVPLRSADRTFWRDLDGDFEHDENEPREGLYLMAASTFPAEGKSKEGQAKGEAEAQGREGRAVFVGDGDFMTNKLATNNGNVLPFVDTLAWLIGNEQLGGDVESEEDVPIVHSREENKVWFYASTFLVPAPVVLVGLWVARRRNRRSEAKA